MDRNEFEKLIAPYHGRIVIDIGAGDGFFVWESARKNPGYFYIGIDPNHSNLIKTSERIYRKPSKGGAPNALFLQAGVEDLPEELNGLAQMVQVQFPWGSLLRSVAVGEIPILVNLWKLCGERAVLKVIMCLDPLRDQSEMKRLNLPVLTPEYVTNHLIAAYEAAGFQINESGILPVEQYQSLKSSWAKRLQRTEQLPVYLCGIPAKNRG